MSNYNTYLGNKKALQFPVMCDGYVKIEYAKNVATTPYGIWELNGDFTIEALITPYDCNGCADLREGISSPTYPNGLLTSQKTMPAVSGNDMVGESSGTFSQDEKYLPIKYRTNYEGAGSYHKMMIFKTSNFELYLENTTLHNHNQPAEYKIVCEMRISNNHVVSSPTIIRARDTNYNLLEDVKYLGSIHNLVELGGTVSANAQPSASFMRFTVTNTKNYVHYGMKIYDENGVYIGPVNSVATGTFNVDTSGTNYLKATYDATAANKVYTIPTQEAPYLEGLYHIAVTYSDALGKISIYINGTLAVTDIHVDRDNDIDTNFTFGNANIYLGQDATLTYPETRKTQYMGEIHELSVSNNYQTEFSSLYTLLPQFRNLVLYLNFEEK